MNTKTHERICVKPDKKAIEAVAGHYSSLCSSLLELVASHPQPGLLLPLVSLAGQGPRFFKGRHQDVIQVVSKIVAQQCQAPTADALEEAKPVMLVALELGTSVFLGAPKVARKVRHIVLINVQQHP